jgi:drug/metabolite transporter (DMT)-like permease
MPSSSAVHEDDRRPAHGRRTGGSAGERAGLLFAGLCALNGAFVAPVARLTTDRAEPLLVAAVTTLFGGLAACAALALRGQLGELLRGRKAPLLVALGALGTVIPNLLFFLGTSRTSAIDAVLCLQIEPFYSLLLAWSVLGHRLLLRRVLSVLLLLAGIALAVGGGGSADPVGLVCLLATPLAWQLSHLLVLKRLVGVAPEILTGARYVWGGLLLAPIAGLLGSATGRAVWPPDVAGFAALLPILALQGVVLSYVGTSLWYQSIARLDLARATAIVVPSIPLLALAASFLIVGEVPSARQLGGLFVAAVAVLSFVLAPHAVELLERIPTPTAPLGAPAGDETGGDGA